MNDYDDNDIDIAANNLLNMFTEIRKECNIKQVHSGPIYLSEAAKLSAIGANASDVNEILAMQRVKDKMDKADFMEKYMQYGIIFAIICMVPVAAYVVVNAM